MDQLTHTVRRSNWINIIRQCQDRPAGTTAKQWLAENDISKKSYYYWLRKIRREVCEQEGLQEVTNPSSLSFVEIPVKTAPDTTPVPTVPAAMTPVAVCKCQYKNVSFLSYKNVGKPTRLYDIFCILIFLNHVLHLIL